MRALQPNKILYLHVGLLETVYFTPIIFNADTDADNTVIVSSLLISHCGQSEGGVPGGDEEEEENGRRGRGGVGGS